MQIVILSLFLIYSVICYIRDVRSCSLEFCMVCKSPAIEVMLHVTAFKPTYATETQQPGTTPGGQVSRENLRPWLAFLLLHRHARTRLPFQRPYGRHTGDLLLVPPTIKQEPESECVM